MVREQRKNSAASKNHVLWKIGHSILAIRRPLRRQLLSNNHIHRSTLIPWSTHCKPNRQGGNLMLNFCNEGTKKENRKANIVQTSIKGIAFKSMRLGYHFFLKKGESVNQTCCKWNHCFKCKQSILPSLTYATHGKQPSENKPTTKCWEHVHYNKDDNIIRTRPHKLGIYHPNFC